MSGKPLSPIRVVPRRFSEATHLIPTPGIEVQRPRRYEPLVLRIWMVTYLLAVTFAVAIALEVAVYLSNSSQGFAVPERNVFKIGQGKTVAPQFLTSFIPTILIAPLAMLWQESDWLMKWYQPYVVLSQGNASAQKSLLLDYIALGNVFSLIASIKNKHPLILVSTLAALVSLIFQPLAGSVLAIQQIQDTRMTTVNSIRSIGLSPDILSLNAFVAAAGFADASVFNELPDPPFVIGGWATAQFDMSQQVVNGTLAVNTTGLRTAANCGNPISSTLSTNNTSQFVINATSLDGCFGSVAFDPDIADQQYGVITVPNCGAPTNISLNPVMFWYFHFRASDNQPEARSVFCHPTIAVFDVIATANLGNGSLVNVTITNTYVAPNNVTGSPQQSQAYNAVLFDTLVPNNTFTQARALAIKSGVSGAIFRFASQLNTGVDAVFADVNGFLNITQTVYTQHLSLSAKSIYFVPSNETLPAMLTETRPKLVVQPLPAHALAVLMFLMGIAGSVIHFINRRERRKVWLATRPGSIAAIVSLTSRSGFGDLLLPYDDEDSITRKLSGLKFGLDPRTGAIVADDAGSGIIESQDETKLGLLGRSTPTRQLSAASKIALSPSTSPPPTTPPHPQLYNPYDKSSDSEGERSSG